MTDDVQHPQSAIERYFFTPLYYPLSPFQVIWWWERRRLAYNVCVGSAGVLSMSTLLLLHPHPSAMADFGMVLGVVLYGLAANACYSVGWMADLALRKVLGIRAPDLAPALLRYGFVFSIGLTLLPIPVAVAGRVLLAIMGVPAAR
jgi:hypothetical protein